jgi:hypothetical protein
MLDATQSQLETRFADLAAMRRPLNYPVYALEHGLEKDQLAEIKKAASIELRSVGLRKEHWLVWAALASEAGYGYAGEEYWPTLELLAGEWHHNDYRDRLRTWFRRFHSTFGGPVPKGRWATHFNIIAWPIANAILPRYLQSHFARHLFDLRYELAHRTERAAEEVGQLLLDRYDGASSRFADFLQQTELTAAIILALRDEDDGGAIPRIAPSLLRRIVDDLEETRAAREYLREARKIIQTHRFSVALALRSAGVHPAVGGVGHLASIPGPRLAARLIPGQGPALGLVFPDFNAALARSGLQASALRNVRMRFPGDAERWTPASGLLTLSRHDRRLSAFPKPLEPVIALQGADGTLASMLDPLCRLEERPCWVMRRHGDGLYRQVVGSHVRADQNYLIIARSELPTVDVEAALLDPVGSPLPDIFAYRLSVGVRIMETQLAALARLTIGTKTGVVIEPAGLSPRRQDAGDVATWLSTETVLLRVRADYNTLAFVVRLDGTDPATVATQEGGILLAFDGLPLGTHSIDLAAVPQQTGLRDAQPPASARFAFQIVAPQPWPEAMRGKAGFRLAVSPANAPLEDVLAGRAQLSVIGPVGRQVHWALDTFDAAGNPASSGKGGVTNIGAPDATVTKTIEQLRKAHSESIDVAHRVDINASIDELGLQLLRFPHIVEPLRWSFDAKKQRVRLIDETAHEEPVVVTGLRLDAPLEKVTIQLPSMLDGMDVTAPGLLLNARYRGRSQTALISVPAAHKMQSFAELDITQRFDLVAEPGQALLNLIRGLAFWNRARALGHLAIVRKATTVVRLCNELATLACGAAFMQLIRLGSPDALQRAQGMVGGSPGFGSRMRNQSWSALLDEAIEPFANYAETYRIETDRSQSGMALTLAYDPLRLRFGYGPDAHAKAQKLLANSTLLRGAYLARARAIASHTIDNIAVVL